MKAFGYKKSGSNQELPLELKEVALSLSPEETDLVVEFLQHAKTRFANHSPIPGQAHCHLRDWWKGWTVSEPDLIVVHGSDYKTREQKGVESK